MPAEDARKIIIVTDAWMPQVNGVVRTYEHLGTELEKLGHGVKIIGPQDFRWCVPMPGYREIDLALFPGRQLARMIRDYGPASLHIATEGPLGWTARRYARRHGIAFTTAYHTQFPAYVARRVARIVPVLGAPVERGIDALIRRFHSAAAGVIITTASLEAELRTRGYKMPLFKMPRGVPVDLFRPGQATLFADLPRPVALYVGRVAIEKNIGAFLDMEWSGSKVVVGDGPSLAALREKYPRILFTGKKTGSELAAHYQSADLFVFPSRTDTFGIVLIEALACGLPVAAYNATGPRDIITEDYLGVLDNDLSEAARRAALLQHEIEKRYAFVTSHFTWPAIARRFIDILNETNT